MDMFKKIAVEQGYIPKECLLPGELIMALINESKNPCDGCHNNRNICKGSKYMGNKYIPKQKQNS